MATILLFAKEPLAGRVKTRLVPPLTAPEAAALAAAFLADLHRTLASAHGAKLAVAIPDDSSKTAFTASVIRLAVVKSGWWSVQVSVPSGATSSDRISRSMMAPWGSRATVG